MMLSIFAVFIHFLISLIQGLEMVKDEEIDKETMLQVSFVRTMDTTYLHIGMILSTLSLSPHGFALGLYPKDLIPMEIFVHPYIPMILPIYS